MAVVVIVLVVLTLLAAWLGLLTLLVLRWRRERGEPVYRRLPNGRVRFEWAVATTFESVRRSPPVGGQPTGATSARRSQ